MDYNEKDKEPVRLRGRKQPKTGNISLYLDTYVNGKRRYEYLKLYLIPERTKADKEKNRNTLKMADAIRSKRVVELRNGQYGFANHRKGAGLFFDFFLSVMERKKSELSERTFNCYRIAFVHLRGYERRNITFEDVTKEWIYGFKQYLKSSIKRKGGRGVKGGAELSNNSQAMYLSKLKAVLREAVSSGFLDASVLVALAGLKFDETERKYLTLPEIERLVETPCRYEGLKCAFLFSCLTGLRYSDVVSLTWGDVHEEESWVRIIFKQQKTRWQEYMDITQEARELLGERGMSHELVFSGRLQIPRLCMNEKLRSWVKSAGIEKHITFHCARHTFATLLLSLGNDLYVVSKLLGHREISTTQIYAKVLDESKREAVATIPSILRKKGDGESG